jgi:hypothetical protein
MQYLKSQEKINLANSPHFILFYFILKKTSNMEMTSYAKARSNLCTFNDATTEKQSFDLLFLSSPKSTCIVLSRNIGGKHNWFLDCI